MGPLPHLYAGFHWSENASFLKKEQMPSLRTDHRAVLFNVFGKDIYFESEKEFDLGGIIVSALWDNHCEVLVEGWIGGVQKYGTAIALTRSILVRQDLAFANVCRVDLRTGGAIIAVHAIKVVMKGNV